MNLVNKNFISDPLHPKHKTLHSLFLILFFVIAAGTVIIYQIEKNNSKVVVEAPIPVKSTEGGLSTEELRGLAEALQRDSELKPTPTAKELSALANTLNSQGKNQKQPTAEELQEIAKKLNEK
jgi:hypothetical protein